MATGFRMNCRGLAQWLCSCMWAKVYRAWFEPRTWYLRTRTSYQSNDLIVAVRLTSRLEVFVSSDDWHFGLQSCFWMLVFTCSQLTQTTPHLGNCFCQCYPADIEEQEEIARALFTTLMLVLFYCDVSHHLELCFCTRVVLSFLSKLCFCTRMILS